MSKSADLPQAQPVRSGPQATKPYIFGKSLDEHRAQQQKSGQPASSKLTEGQKSTLTSDLHNQKGGAHGMSQGPVNQQQSGQ